jgi:hypothetical protein
MPNNRGMTVGYKLLPAFSRNSSAGRNFRDSLSPSLYSHQNPEKNNPFCVDENNFRLGFLCFVSFNLLEGSRTWHINSLYKQVDCVATKWSPPKDSSFCQRYIVLMATRADYRTPSVYQLTVRSFTFGLLYPPLYQWATTALEICRDIISWMLKTSAVTSSLDIPANDPSTFSFFFFF